MTRLTAILLAVLVSSPAWACVHCYVGNNYCTDDLVGECQATVTPTPVCQPVIINSKCAIRIMLDGTDICINGPAAEKAARAGWDEPSATPTPSCATYQSW